MQMTDASLRALHLSQVEMVTFDDLEYFLSRSRAFAWALIVGLPGLGILASLFLGLPLFASLMAGSFLLATALVCRKAVARFTGRTLRLLVAARLVIVLVIAALLFSVTGTVWTGIVSALLLWLTAERLLGRYALNHLGLIARNRKAAQALPVAVSPRLGSMSDPAARPVPEDDPGEAVSKNGDATHLFPSPDVPADVPADEVVKPRRRRRKS